MPSAVKPTLNRALDAGIIVIRASRVGSGSVSAGPVDAECGTISAGWLNPQKERLLLMLALSQTGD